jgi:hypothetical protein
MTNEPIERFPHYCKSNCWKVKIKEKNQGSADGNLHYVTFGRAQDA